MKKMKFAMLSMLAAVTVIIGMGQAAPNGCDGRGGVSRDRERQIEVGNKLARAQATPTDIQFSLERYNLIRRAYWVNGMRDRAASLPCPVEKPIGYIVLLTRAGTIFAQYIVDGKVSSLGSYLTPVSERYATCNYADWLPDVDGCFGDNDKDGIFFFTPEPHYKEWKGEYLYSDVPFDIQTPVMKVRHVNSDN